MFTNVHERDLTIIEALKHNELQELLESALKTMETDNSDNEAAGVALLCAWGTADGWMMENVAERALADSLGVLLLRAFAAGMSFDVIARECFLRIEDEVRACLKEAQDN